KQARVVVLDADDDRLADPPGPRGLAAIAGGPVARRVELRGRKRVDVQQGAGLGPLITSRSRAGPAAAPVADAVAPQNLPDRRARPARQPRQPHRPPVRLLARLENPLLLLGAQRPWAGLRHRPPRQQTREIGPLGLAGLAEPITHRLDRRR